ncbi:MAG: hypothetical protein P8144_07685 [Gammaproteobacteria bacterium]
MKNNTGNTDHAIANQASFLNFSQVLAVSIGLQLLLIFFLGPLAVLFIALACALLVAIVLRFSTTPEPLAHPNNFPSCKAIQS